jgi:hypothetical protein
MFDFAEQRSIVTRWHNASWVGIIRSPDEKRQKPPGEILYPRAKGNSGEIADSQNGVFQQREFLEFVRVPAVGNSVAYTLGRSLTVVGDHGPESCRRSTFPPVALIVAVTILAIVAVCACYLPVRRACRVNPLTVLRSD